MKRAKSAPGVAPLTIRLDPTPNAMAIAPIRPRSRTIGFVYPLYAPQVTGLEMKFIAHAANVVNQANEAFLLLTHPERQPENLERFVQNGLLDGVILMQVRLQDPRVQLLQQMAVPFVLVGRCADNTGLAYVDSDIDAAMELCLEHLASQGHQAIVYLHQNDPEFGFAARMLAAYSDGCERRGLPILTRTCGMSVEAGQSAMEAMLGLHPEITGVIAWTDRVAWGAHEAARATGRRVPDDVSIISIEMSSPGGLTPRNLTHIDIHADEMASRAARLLLDLLDGRPASERQVLVAPDFIIGDTTAPPGRGRAINNM